MTAADHQAVAALARHLAYIDGEWWDQCHPTKQGTYRARALDLVQCIAPIYQPDTFPRPRGCDR